MDLVKQFKHANRTIKIYVDPDPINPVKEYDEYTHMTCAHRRYNLGHEQHSEPMTEDEVRENVSFHGDEILAILPLSLFDHSGISISTGISRGWDSGQVGWAYVTRSQIEKMGDASEPYVENDPRLLEIIEQDVKSYDQYLQGECYGFVIEGSDGEELDSCWGYLGDVQYCIDEAKSAAEGTDDPAVTDAAEALAARTTYAGVSP